MRAVTYLDSYGVGALLDLASRLALNRQRLVIVVQPDHPVRRVLEITGVEAACLVCDSVEAALQAERGPGGK